MTPEALSSGEVDRLAHLRARIKLHAADFALAGIDAGTLLEQVTAKLDEAKATRQQAEAEQWATTRRQEEEAHAREAEAAAAATSAAIFLTPLLRKPTPRDDIVTEAQAQGITSRALGAACRELGVAEYALHGCHARLWGLPGIERFGGGYVRLGAATL